jgi:hypothetical protein
MGVQHDLGTEPRRFRQASSRDGRPGRTRHDVVFQPHHADTTGYGDIVPIDPFARSLANLESLLGQFCLAITIARLVTLELEDRRR